MARFIKILASLKFAVAIIISFAIISAVGTIIEARFDSEFAKAMVYESIYMRGLAIALALCLIAVMVDRWPWRRHHTGFIMAHIGILILMFGQWLTANYGIDGTLTFEFGESSRYVVLPKKEIQIFAATMDGESTKLYSEEVNFLLHPLKPGHPKAIIVSGKKVLIKDYYHYALVDERITASERKGDGPAIRFALGNERVTFSEWMHLASGAEKKSLPLGPATVTFAKQKVQPQAETELVLYPDATGKKVAFDIYLKGKKLKSGTAVPGSSLQTGWMNLTLRLFNYYPNAQNLLTFKKQERPSATTTSAVLVDFDGTEQWVPLNSLAKFFDANFGYVFYYGQKRMPLNFELTLKDFKVGRYQGTTRASSYQSVVQLPNKEEVVISMNNPLKMDGYTFYQASFQEDDMGKPLASILSVNWDPGRLLKYLGSLMIVLGSILLFWFKRAAIFKGKAKVRAKVAS